MCKVKTGKAVLNLQDVQNLVTGIIFRQVYSFQREELLEAVIHYMDESPLQNDQQNIKKIVDTTLMTCISNDWLTYQQGSFIPSQTVNALSPKVG